MKTKLLLIMIYSFMLPSLSYGQVSTWYGYQALYNGMSSLNNSAFGYQALYTLPNGEDGGTDNTGIRYIALTNNGLGSFNTAVGSQTLIGNVEGTNNTAIGCYALYSGDGAFNTAIGSSTLENNDNAENDVAVGYTALNLNTSGSFNDAVGGSALSTVDTGNYNDAMGYSALLSNTASFNDAFGYFALEYNTTGTYNVGMGPYALTDNHTGSNNVAVGLCALYYNTVSNNTATGCYALFSNATGSNNSAFGSEALIYNETGDDNCGFGDGAGAMNENGSDNVFIGPATGAYTTADGNTFVGYFAGFDNETDMSVGGTYNTTIGYLSDIDPNTNISNATAIGAWAIVSTNNTVVLGSDGSIGGSTAVTQVDFNGALAPNYGGGYNTGTAGQVLESQGAAAPQWVNAASVDGAWNITGNSNTTYSAASGAPTGNFIGTISGSDYGIMLAVDGIIAGRIEDDNSGNDSYKNTSLGYKALNANAGTDNTAFGYLSGEYNTTGTENTFIGEGTGTDLQGGSYAERQTTGSNNTFVGYNASAYYVSPGTDYTDCAAFGSNAINNEGSGTIVFGDAGVSSGFIYGSLISASDGRFKKNINSNVIGLNFINKLKPVTYNFDVEGLDEHVHGGKINHTSQELEVFKKKDSIVYSGFIAQDMEAAAKATGYNFDGVHKPQNDHDTYGIAYSELVVPLTKAVQELSAKSDSKDSMIAQQQQQLTDQANQIEALQSANSEAQTQLQNQQSQLDQLSAMVSKLDIALSQCCTNYESTTTGSSQTGSNTTDAPLLNQNIPNPFSQNTVISCYVPSTAKGASIIVYDLNGVILKSFTIPTTGFNQITITGGSLAAGDYLYTLFVDGQKIDTKKMTLTH